MREARTVKIATFPSKFIASFTLHMPDTRREAIKIVSQKAV